MSGIVCSMVGATFSVAAAAQVIRYKKGIQAIGNAKISTGASKFGGTSAVFDGTGDYLSTTIDNIGTSDFTIECWFRPTNFPRTTPLITTRDPDTTAGFALFFDSSKVYFGTTGGNFISGTTTLANNTWYHIAVSRSGTSMKMFLNGTQEGSTATNSSDFSNTNLWVARGTPSPFVDYSGYVDELRVSKTARYTANFTAPTAPFVNDDNTVLLIHANGTNNSTYFEDDNGTVRDPMNGWQGGTGMSLSTTQSKFGGTSLYVSTNDNDIYHNQYSAGGTGNALINFGTGNFTVEFWIYPNSSNTNTTIGVITKRNYSSTANGTWGIRYNASNRVITWENIFPTVTSQSTSTSAFTFNTWSHWAFVRNSGTLKIYVDGVEKSSASNSLDFTYYNEPLRIGDWGAGASSGLAGAYLDEIRISDTARYTSGFTPSTTPFVNDSNTLLLLHMDGNNASSIANIHDDNGEGRSQKGVLAVSSAQVSSTQSKFGGTSLSLNGSSQYLTVPYQSDLAIMGTSFTLEAWIYPTAFNAGAFGKIIMGTSTASSGWCIRLFSNKLQWVYSGQGGYDTGTISFSTNTWYHIAAVRSGTTIKFYVNGTEYSISGYVDRTTNNTNDLKIGIDNYAEVNSYFSGYIDEVRISNTARYTADFTPSTTPFAPDSNTLLLLHMDGTNASTTFIDDNGRRTYTP